MRFAGPATRDSRCVETISVLCSDSKQDWWQFVSLLQVGLLRYKEHNPHIKTVHLFSDGAGNLHSVATKLYITTYLNSKLAKYDIRIVSFDHSEGGEGKTVLDTTFAHIKNRRMQYIRGGGSGTNVQENIIAFQSGKSVVGCSFIEGVIGRTNEPAAPSNIIDFSKWNGFTFQADGSMICHQSTNIGKGKSFSRDALLRMWGEIDSESEETGATLGFVGNGTHNVTTVESPEAKSNAALQKRLKREQARQERLQEARAVVEADKLAAEGRGTFFCDHRYLNCGRAFATARGRDAHQMFCNGPDSARVKQLVTGKAALDAYAVQPPTRTAMQSSPAIVDEWLLGVPTPPLLLRGYGQKGKREVGGRLKPEQFAFLVELFWKGQKSRVRTSDCKFERECCDCECCNCNCVSVSVSVECARVRVRVQAALMPV